MYIYKYNSCMADMTKLKEFAASTKGLAIKTAKKLFMINGFKRIAEMHKKTNGESSALITLLSITGTAAGALVGGSLGGGNPVAIVGGAAVGAAFPVLAAARICECEQWPKLPQDDVQENEKKL